MTGSLTSRIGDWIADHAELSSHPCRTQLAVFMGSGTSLSSAGFPYVSEAGFRVFVEQVPHLFTDGLELLRWLRRFERALGESGVVSESEGRSVTRAVKVARTMILTAGVTAPPDLWVVRQVLAAHERAGLIDLLLSSRGPVRPGQIGERLGLDSAQVEIDLHLLVARGYLEQDGDAFAVAGHQFVDSVLADVSELPAEHLRNWIPSLVEFISTGREPRRPAIAEFLRLATPDRTTGTWVASVSDLEVGFRLLPIVLALHVAGRTEGLARGESAEVVVGPAWKALEPVLQRAGMASEGRITELGARVFARGPGPFGIVAAYQPYFAEIDRLLRPGAKQVWVRRADNVAASQDANRKTFLAANDALDRFCGDWDFTYSVFIEHAVGQGEAVRQRFERDGEAAIRYFGADLEDSAIDQAVRQQQLGVLPSNMEFIRRADIGEPAKVIEWIESRGLETAGAVMMVGNGFHEIRNQTNERMRQVFREYGAAGILIVFTEETALSDDDLVATAWNTYHSGFRYVHQLSGQGLRPTWGGDDGRVGWQQLARDGGYVVLEEYCYRSRTIYPLPRTDRRNPAISMSYFCVPRPRAEALGIPLESDD